jgi:glycosyltransferase involved in cell wall biosynthesis
LIIAYYFMPEDRFHVAVSNGCHRFHMYQTALACQEAGALQCFIAGGYLKHEGIIRFLRSPLAIRMLGARTVKGLLARRQDGLDPAKVVGLLVPDLVERLGRITIGRRFPPGFFSYWSMKLFGWRSQDFIKSANLFHVRSGYGRFAMAQAKRQGAVCLVDHSIADPRLIAEMLQSEASHWCLAYEFPKHHWRCVSQDIDDADHILANSKFVRDTLVSQRRIPPRKITVLNLPVDLQCFSPSTGEKSTRDPFRILFVGEIGLRKGVLYLLKAFENLNLAGAELILVGQVEEIGSYLAQSKAKFRHIPIIPQQDLVHYYQNSSVFVFPSLIEGSARVIQEAMACGLPVITTPNSGSIVRDGVEGFVVPIRDPESISERILELFNQPAVRKEMGLAARTAALSNFKPQLYREGLIRLYTLLLQNRCNNN